MFSFAAVLILSFFLGMRHAGDPDHIVAVTTIVTKQHGIAKAGLIGALWGLGHTFTIFVVGTLIILFQITIPPRLGLAMELLVAAMLIVLGLLNLTGTLRRLKERFTSGVQFCRVPNPPYGNNLAATQPDVSLNAAPRERMLSRSCWPPIFRNLSWYNIVRPLLIGTVHGLAGSAAVALLVMSTIHNPWCAIAYLLLFGIGTIAGMMLVNVVIALPVAVTTKRFAGWNRRMALASGVLSVGFGLFLSYHIGFVDGLFGPHPRWNPH